jgi:phospholipid/cholesterol/gamma-HCH transport system permease protein
MTVTEQIDAMRAMGADPVRELVVPRVLASALALPLCTVVADVLGIAGAMVVARLDDGINMTYFLHATLRAVTLSDFAGGLVKTVFFGLSLALIACRCGLGARGGTQGVGRATTQAVVLSSITTLTSDFVLTRILLELGL